MTTQTTHPNDERIHELMVDMTLGEITPEDERILTSALADDPELKDRMLDTELAAASAQLALLGLGDESMLTDAQDDDFIPRLSGTPAEPKQGASSAWMVMAGVGWAAAAALLVAVLIQFAGTLQSTQTEPSVTARADFIAQHDDTVTLDWNDWALEGAGPEIEGVGGDVVWSDSAQRGYMRFVGLPQNDPSDMQYQLWIVDAERGMSQRISGGVFNADESGEIVVPIDDPEIPVNEAAAFALTIEKPGGVWVSDMSRRVVIAAK